MNYQDIIGCYHETTVAQLIDQCPQTVDILSKYVPDLDANRQATVEAVASIADINPDQLCQELFDTVMEQTPIEALDTDVLLELIIRGYDVGHVEQLSKLHRLARKIEAVHRTHRDVPKGITLAIKKLERSLTAHLEQENAHVLTRMKHEQPRDLEIPIAQMNEEHSLIKLQLRKLRQMTQSYSAPESACRSWQRFYRELKALDFRLSERIYLERDVLFPRFQL